MGDFEDNLYEHLMARYGAELATAERPHGRPTLSRRMVSAAVVLVALVAGLVAGAEVLGKGAPAYAVTVNDDGTATISLDDARAIEPANARLRELGIRAKVVPTTKNCPPADESREIYLGPLTSADLPRPGPGNSIILANTAPDGWTVLLTISPHPGRGTGLGYTGFEREPTPDCMLDPGDDPEYRSGGG